MKRKGKKMAGMILVVVMMMAMTVPAQAARSDSFITLYSGYYYSGTLDLTESGAWRAVRATVTSEAQKWAVSNVTSASDIVENSNLQGAEVDYHAGYYLTSTIVKTLSVSR